MAVLIVSWDLAGKLIRDSGIKHDTVADKTVEEGVVTLERATTKK